MNLETLGLICIESSSSLSKMVWPWLIFQGHNYLEYQTLAKKRKKEKGMQSISWTNAWIKFGMFIFGIRKGDD